MRLGRLSLALLLLAILAPAAALLTRAARAQQSPNPAPQSPAPLYVVAFVDFAGGGTVTADGTSEIQEYVRDTRKDPGIIRCEALAQVGRINHLVIMEVWQNQEAFDKHEGAQHTKAFRANIQEKLGAPFDQRLHFVVQ